MKNIRLIASDIDGTILPFGGRISDRTRAAVRRCREMGIRFVICSGRWYLYARKVAHDLGHEEELMIIANGGAVVQPDGTPLMERTVAPEDVRRAYGIMRNYNVMINAFVRDGIYRINTAALTGPFPGEKTYDADDRCRIVNDDVAAFEEKGLARPYYLEAYSDDFPLLSRLRGELMEAGLAVSSSFPRNIEVMSPGMGKGSAVRWLAEQMGVAREQCMAFGDNINDVRMLEAVGWPVAMGNAMPELKACARIIAPDAAEDGVASIIAKVVFGEEWT